MPNVTLTFLTPNNGKIPVRELKVRIRPEGNALRGMQRSQEFITNREGKINFPIPNGSVGKFYINVKECTSGFKYTTDIASPSVTITQGMHNTANYPYSWTVTVRETVCRLPVTRRHNSSPSVSPRENLPEFKGSGVLTLEQFVEYYADDVLNRVVTRYVGNDSSPRTEAATIGNRIINYPQRGLSNQDYEVVARELNIDLNSIKAFAQVEAGGAGFLPCGIPKILYERHVLYRNSGRRNNPLNLQNRELSSSSSYVLHPNSSTPQIDRYAGGLFGSWVRFIRAYEKGWTLNEVSCGVSWGLFQVLGENYSSMRLDTAIKIADMSFKGEKEHLKIFFMFARMKPGLIPALRRRDWESVARIYNGSNNVSVYAPRFRNEYNRLTRGGR